jgi:hypothetical protein
MKTIAERIYNGETAGVIGIGEPEYLERKKLLEEYLSEHDWNGVFFVEWLHQKDNLIVVGRGYADAQIWVHSQLPPSAKEKANGFLSSAKDVVVSGMKFAPKEEYDKRISVCSGCLYFKDARCQKCGCYIKIKAKFGATSCPLNLWN